MKGQSKGMGLSLDDVVGNLGDYTLDSILITKAEPQDWPVGPEIVWCNKAFSEMTGYELSEIIGQTPRLLQGELTNKDAVTELGRQLRNWEFCKADLYNYKKDGTGFWVELSIFPVKDEKGWFHYWVSIQRDITERKGRELELQKANLKIIEYQKYIEAFSYSVFHDLRSPLRLVGSMMESINEDDGISGLSKDTQDMFGIVQDRIDRMRILVRDVSAHVAARQHGSGSLSKIAIQSWLAEIFNDLNPHGLHQLHVKTELDELHVPKNEFQTIFANLFDNALKHNAKPEVNVHVKIERIESQIVITVDDDGNGIPEDIRAQIFDPFSQPETARNGSKSGFGLGFIRQIVSLNGGSVHVEHSPQGGARFVIRWNID
jgi:PAS domain S-box-containing protein